MYTLYILYNQIIDKFYIGTTNNLKRRLWEHNNLRSKKRFTNKQKGKWNLVYIEEYSDKILAIKREKVMKKQKSRNFIEDLIKNQKSANSSMDRAAAF